MMNTEFPCTQGNIPDIVENKGQIPRPNIPFLAPSNSIQRIWFNDEFGSFNTIAAERDWDGSMDGKHFSVIDIHEGNRSGKNADYMAIEISKLRMFLEGGVQWITGGGGWADLAFGGHSDHWRLHQSRGVKREVEMQIFSAIDGGERKKNGRVKQHKIWVDL